MFGVQHAGPIKWCRRAFNPKRSESVRHDATSYVFIPVRSTNLLGFSRSSGGCRITLDQCRDNSIRSSHLPCPRSSTILSSEMWIISRHDERFLYLRKAYAIARSCTKAKGSTSQKPIEASIRAISSDGKLMITMVCMNQACGRELLGCINMSCVWIMLPCRR